ncbi:hypothetical protein VPNG_02449 [Cytospora leucostoma]|uniref:Uncharacterized protein n=1 Tax=Cytospora leucostoma TaxID=1230097 RepID=A0A423XHX9_9PEZI|nr:hypothetical protein VPNG_02449 [Cytospora leucostoma]
MSVRYHRRGSWDEPTPSSHGPQDGWKVKPWSLSELAHVKFMVPSMAYKQLIGDVLREGCDSG